MNDRGLQCRMLLLLMLVVTLRNCGPRFRCYHAASLTVSSIGRHALRSCSVIQDMIGVVGMGERDVMK